MADTNGEKRRETLEERQAQTLNEAYSDIMAELIEIYYNEEDGKWENMLPNVIIRSASNPEEFHKPSKVGGEYFDTNYSNQYQNMTVMITI